MPNLTRRDMLIFGASGLTYVALPPRSAKARDTSRYIGARRLGNGITSPFHYVASVADATGHILRDIPLPARGHGFAVSPDGRHAVALARRPGTFAVAFSVEGPGPEKVFFAPSGRHFQGHAVFEPTGRHLFATENDFENGRGCIGVYDAADGFRRVAELPSHGIGAHELVLMPDGKTLAVANGGILTHPDSGRAKLNIATMAPNLTYLELTTGRLQDSIAHGTGRRSKLSIRHLAAFPDGRVVVACQDQGARTDGLPLVGVHRPGSGRIEDLTAPPDVLVSLQGYCGSVSVDRGGRLAAVTAPRGGQVLFWNTVTKELVGRTSLPDGCGVSPGPAEGTFVLTNGLGAFFVGGPGLTRTRRRETNIPWDNHLYTAPSPG